VEIETLEGKMAILVSDEPKPVVPANLRIVKIQLEVIPDAMPGTMNKGEDFVAYLLRTIPEHYLKSVRIVEDL
jgi:hypothetical protein